MNVRLKHEIHFTAGVYYQDHMAMNNYRVTLWMVTNSTDSADQGTAFERIKYFIYSQMESTIFIDQDQEDQCHRLVDAGLNITTMPGEPVDQLIGIMLWYKLNAICEGRMVIMETEISSALGEDMMYLHSEYETTSGYDQPEWWTSADLTHSDFIQPNAENIVTMPGHTDWSNLELSWTPDEQDTTGNIVVFADFKKPNDTD
jgi:hypothetical protein